MNRTKERTDAAGERSPSGDFYVVVSQYNTFYVSAAMAAHVGGALGRRWVPRWVKFVDLAGSRVWLRTSAVDAVYESTTEQRGRDRVFHRARREEDRADRPAWEDD
jgi:hypothetical protein